MRFPLPFTVQGVSEPSGHNQRIHLFYALSAVPVEVQDVLPVVAPVAVQALLAAEAPVELHPAPNVLPFVFPVASLVAGS